MTELAPADKKLVHRAGTTGGQGPHACSGVAEAHMALAHQFSAHNYAPLPIVVSTAEGAWVTDVTGRRYLDALSAYSAVNFGHRNPRLVAVAERQLQRATLVSRAFHHDTFGGFCQALAQLLGKDAVLPMNTGAEAVETAIKVARKWGYERKAVPPDCASVVVAAGNFHGRTTTIVGFSSDPVARRNFGPYAPGFRVVPYGDADAAAEAIDATTVAVLIEPVQGEAGVIIPPADYLPRLRQICDRHGVLLVADEVQSGLGRAGATLACELVGVDADMYAVGKALGGGIVPVSAVVADRSILGVLSPGEHGSTFGGNPLACAIGHEVVQMLEEGTWQARARTLGAYLQEGLVRLIGSGLTSVRAVGLWAGVDVDPAYGSGRDVCNALLERDVLAKDTHGQTLRLSPPLCISEAEVGWLVEQLASALRDYAGKRHPEDRPGGQTSS